MNIAIVDDDVNEKNMIMPMIIEAFSAFKMSIDKIEYFSTPQSFIDKFKVADFDLIILDIIMGKMTGIELARIIRKIDTRVKIVFSSTSNEFACESYDVNAIYYIQKPVTIQAVYKMIEKINVDEIEKRKFIILPDKRPLVVREIILAEYSNHLINIELNTKKNIKIWFNFNELEELLYDYTYLIKVNRGTIINLFEVINYKDYVFTLSNSISIPVSRGKRKEVEEKYNHFLIECIK